MPVILIIGILIVLAVLVLYILRMFHVEKIEVEEYAKPKQQEPELVGREEADLSEMVSLLQDLPQQTEEKPEQTELYQQHEIPQFDSLCELKIGAEYAAECHRVLARAREDSARWAVVCLDIDRFRFINSLKGMSTGDYVITNLSYGLREIFPEDSLVTRISADHFSICFPFFENGMLVEYNDQLRRVCEKIRTEINLKSSLRVCMGICTTDAEGGTYDYDVLLQKANIARHCLKVSKSEAYVFYNESMVSTKLYGESALDDFNENQYDEEIVAYFQPQSDIVKNRIVAAQALLRWSFEEIAHKELPVGVENGRLPANARRMIYQVCRTVSRWRKAGKEVLPVFVYLPPTELFKDDIDEFVVRCVSEFQLEPHLLVLVVDIASYAISEEVTRPQVRKLADVGVLLAVDGCIYLPERLELLRDEPIAYLKIPRGLTGGLDKDAARLDYLNGLKQQALDMNMKPVFEGVDETAQMNTIQRIGGVLAEGRYAGRAIVGEDFAKVLKEYVQKQRIIGDNTVILDDETMQSGDFNAY